MNKAKIQQNYLFHLRQIIKTNPNGILTPILSLTNISWKAKALALAILNCEQTFQNPGLNKEELLVNESKEGIEAIRSGIKELQHAGLLRKTIRRDTGRRKIIGSTWEINFIHDEEVSDGAD